MSSGHTFAWLGSAPVWAPASEIHYVFSCDAPACAGSDWAVATTGGALDDVLEPWWMLGSLDVAPDGRWACGVSAEDPAVVIASPNALASAVVIEANAWMPRWSPSGRHDALLRSDGLYTKRPDTSAATRVFAYPVHSFDW